MIYLVTGAAGHLGGVTARLLLARGERVRAFVLPGEEARAPAGAQVFSGNVLDRASLAPAFADGEGLTVIHCAGVISIASRFQQNLQDVNVTGTENVAEACRERGARMVYVSSVHAIPELPHGQVMTEIADFDPARVQGHYAKSKAEATRRVLRAARAGLDVRVVHPSGISGPDDPGHGHITQLLIDYCKGHLTAGIARGGYDFVDVRDVAQGILACCERGRPGECYILSNRYFEVRALLELFHAVTGRRAIRTFLPMWFAKGTAPLAETYYRLLRKTPLYTPYSLYTLTSNARFSHEKATRELGYAPRPMEETIRDTFAFLQSQGRV